MALAVGLAGCSCCYSPRACSLGLSSSAPSLRTPWTAAAVLLRNVPQDFSRRLAAGCSRPQVRRSAAKRVRAGRRSHRWPRCRRGNDQCRWRPAMAAGTGGSLDDLAQRRGQHFERGSIVECLLGRASSAERVDQAVQVRRQGTPGPLDRMISRLDILCFDARLARGCVHCGEGSLWTPTPAAVLVTQAAAALARSGVLPGRAVGCRSSPGCCRSRVG